MNKVSIIFFVLLLFFSCTKKNETTPVYQHTIMAVHTNVTLDNENNFVYCAVFQLAWDYAKKTLIGEDIRFGDATADRLAQTLNASEIKEDLLSPDSFKFSLHSLAPDEKIPSEVRKYIAPDILSQIKRGDAGDFIVQTSIRKNISFMTPFTDLGREPLLFQHESVKSFGCSEVTDKSVLDQVKICYYKNDNDFIIKLVTKGEDEIYLAKIKPRATLEETISFVDANSSTCVALGNADEVVIPSINFKLSKVLYELMDIYMINPGFTAYRIAYAGQDVDYTLNENGSKLDANAVLYIAVDGVDDFGDSTEPQYKEFIFDRPFLLYAKEKDAHRPYLVIWFNNGELFDR